jgi:hypothetical protein
VKNKPLFRLSYYIFARFACFALCALAWKFTIYFLTQRRGGFSQSSQRKLGNHYTSILKKVPNGNFRPALSGTNNWLHNWVSSLIFKQGLWVNHQALKNKFCHQFSLDWIGKITSIILLYLCALCVFCPLRPLRENLQIFTHAKARRFFAKFAKEINRFK